MTTHKLRVGIIGLGWYGATALVPTLRATGRAEIVAVARRNAERLAFLQKELGIDKGYTDWQAMLDQEELDAVMVCTPDHLHVEPTLAALERGLHVFVEKPLALTYCDAQRMVQAAERAGRVLMVGYNARGMHSWRTIKQLVAAGKIGQVRQVNVTCAVDLRLLWQPVPVAPQLQAGMATSPVTQVTLGDAMAPDAWRRAPTKEGIGFVDVGTHVLDLALWLAGAAPAEVAALRQPMNSESASVINVQAALTNGAALSLTFNDTINGGDFSFYGHGRLTLYGDEGLLTADWSGFMTTEAQTCWLERAGQREQVAVQGEPIFPAAAFVATVLDDAPNLAPAAEAARVVALSEAAYYAATEKRIMAVAHHESGAL